MNILEWMQETSYIKKKVASIYLSNYDGTESPDLKVSQQAFNLPPAHIRFGDYNTTGIVKDNEIYFWTTTSHGNWTLDMVAI
jgi:hypothetical protein